MNTNKDINDIYDLYVESVKKEDSKVISESPTTAPVEEPKTKPAPTKPETTPEKAPKPKWNPLRRSPAPAHQPKPKAIARDIKLFLSKRVKPEVKTESVKSKSYFDLIYEEVVKNNNVKIIFEGVEDLFKKPAYAKLTDEQKKGISEAFAGLLKPYSGYGDYFIQQVLAGNITLPEDAEKIADAMQNFVKFIKQPDFLKLPGANKNIFLIKDESGKATFEAVLKLVNDYSNELIKKGVAGTKTTGAKSSLETFLEANPTMAKLVKTYSEGSNTYNLYEITSNQALCFYGTGESPKKDEYKNVHNKWCVKDESTFKNISQGNPYYLITKNGNYYILFDLYSGQAKNRLDGDINEEMAKETLPLIKDIIIDEIKKEIENINKQNSEKSSEE